MNTLRRNLQQPSHQDSLRWLRWLLIMALVAATLAVTSLPIVADEDDDDRLFESNEIVIKVNPATNATVEEINSTYGTSTLNMLLSSRGIYLLQIPPHSGGDNGDEDDNDDDDRLEELVETMAEDSRLLYVEPNFIGAPPEKGGRNQFAWGGADDASYNGQYAAQMLKLAEVHALSRGAGSVVAVLDTGFQLDHPALAGSLTDARYDFVDDDTTPTEDFASLDANGDGVVDTIAGHGTHIATTVLLIAPDAQIMPLRVLNENGYGNVFLIAEAVDFAIANGADVINLSLGTTAESEILGDVIEDAASAGLIVVAAAGNLASSTPIFPAADEDVLAVGAVDQNKQQAAFSNHGAWLAIGAPGEAIYSGFPMSGYASWSGTSMATPFIAGQAALIQAAQPELSGAAIISQILTTAEPLNANLGAGLMNPLASLQSDAANAAPQACDCEDNARHSRPVDDFDDCDDNGGPGDDDDDDPGDDDNGPGDDDEDDLVIRNVDANELTVAVCHLTQFGLFGDLDATGAVFLPIVTR